MRKSWETRLTLVVLVSGFLASAAYAQIGARVPNWTVPGYGSSSSKGSGEIGKMADVTYGLAFIGVAPCRIVDTRGPAGPYGAPSMAAGVARNFALVAGPCTGLPPNPAAYSLNITVTNTLGAGVIKIYPQGGSVPIVSTLNYVAGQTLANAAIVPSGTGAGVTIIAGVSGTDLIVDINGYFVGQGSLSPLNPNEYVGWQGSIAAGVVFGWNTNPSGSGVSGLADTGRGVLGQTNGTGLGVAGVWGTSANAIGTFGGSTNTNGMWAQSTNWDALAAFGGREGAYLQGARHGMIGVSTGTTGALAGVIGFETSNTNGSAGVQGTAYSGAPNGGNGLSQFDPAGVLGLADSLPDLEAGVHGITRAGGGYGGRFTRIDTIAPYAPTSDVFLAYANGSAAVFQGDVFIQALGGGPGNLTVAGTLSKGAGAFKIDHPLDPENKYLYHSFVESPDMMNVYNGNVVLDQHGQAIVELPAYFEALNGEFRYQLTSIGRFSPVYVADEIQNNQFRIAGGRPGAKVSWQVTGIRQDAFAKAHRIVAEVAKEDEARGLYLHPVEHDKAPEMSLSAKVQQMEQALEKEKANAD